MRPRQFANVLRTAIAVTLSVAANTSAFASGFALLEQSGSRLGTAFSGTATAGDDATTVFFNPAGLTALAKSEVAVIASGVDITSEFSDSGSQAALGQPLGNDGGNAGGFNFVPSAYFAAPIANKLTIGFAINAPFGLKTEYSDGWMGRFQALKSEIKTFNFNPTIAYRVNDWLSVGLGADYQKIQAELTSAVNYSAVVAQGLQQLVLAGQLAPAAVPALLAANAGLEGKTAVRGDDTAWGFNVGLLFNIESTGTKIGLAYRSAIDYQVQGNAQFTAPTISNATGAAIVAGASVPGGPIASGPVSVKLKVPDSAVLSVAQQLGSKVELLADVARTGWSSVQELRVVRDTGATLSLTPELWRNTWRFAIGGTYQVSPAWKLRAGVAHDQTPVPDSTRTPRLPDTNRVWTAFGARWLPAESVVVDFGYAHLFSKDVPLNQNAGNSAAYGVLVGDQSSAIDILSVQLGYRF